MSDEKTKVSVQPRTLRSEHTMADLLDAALAGSFEETPDPSPQAVGQEALLNALFSGAYHSGPEREPAREDTNVPYDKRYGQ